ncbi:odorant receptor 4-like [Hylaeus anthracinus]|uniref:odorant receptor 4-like n=1 Tax=Hylaeus anthracinus TaxID=313031 RepID=UPI0023B8A891|nr:odorant receptor 4-like [Hylaeus anthracinus]
MRSLVQDQNAPKPRNSYYERDIAFVLKHIRWIMNSLGMWPAVQKGAGRFLPTVMKVLCNLVLLFAIIPFFFHVVYELKDAAIRLQFVGLLGFCILSFFKYWALAVRRPRLESCIEHIQTNWKQVELGEDRKLMMAYGKIGRNLTIICLVFMYTGGSIFHTITQYAIGTFIDEHNRTIKPLVYPIYSALYDAQRSPVYQLVYIVHCMCGYVIYSVTAGACGLAALFVTHICGQIDIVISRLNNLVDRKQNSNPNGRLIEIVEHHLRTLRFSAMVETILQEVCLMEFVGSTIFICLLEYYIITAWEQDNTVNITTYTLLLISLTFNVFILCYIGDLLIEKSSSVGISCFTMDWYNLPTNTVRGLILIIAISNNPTKITAGGIVDLNLSTFGSILKTSLAYLSILRTAVV